MLWAGLSWAACGGAVESNAGRDARATVAQDGAPKAVIVLGDQPTRSAQLGAKELQAHIRAITGAELAIVTEPQPLPAGLLPICVGESQATRALGLTSAGMAPRESLVRVTSAAVILLGRDDPDTGPVTYEANGVWPGFRADKPFYELGTLHAVYDFLEDFCGVRWYMVTDLGTCIPKQATLAFAPQEHRATPWARYRITTRNLWQIPGELSWGDKEMTPAPARENNLFLLRCRLGGEPYNVCHSLSDYYTRFGDSHPEWFVGKPGPDIQLRFNHPGVFRQIVDDANAFFSTPPGERRFGVRGTVASSYAAGNYFPVVPNDNRDFGTDTDPPLQESRRQPGRYGSGVASDYYFAFVNRVAAAVAEKHPGAWISSIAYSDMFEPPTFPLASNVAVSVCMADGWAADSYGLNVLKRWCEKSRHVYVWEYYLHAVTAVPVFRPHAVGEYLTELERIGVQGWFSEMPSFHGKGLHRNPALYHLDAYLTYRMLRKRGMDWQRELELYYRNFYGPAADPMRRFWDALETVGQNLPTGSAIEKWASPAMGQAIESMEKDLLAAEALATESPYRDRLLLIRASVQELMVQSREKDVALARHPVPSLQAGRLSTPLQMDGKLDESAWQSATPTANFVHMDGGPSEVNTTVKVLNDGATLYLGFDCQEPFMDRLTLNQTIPSAGICTDDSVEVMVGGTNIAENGFIHIMLNAEGLSIAMWPKRQGRKALDELGVRGAAHRGTAGWTAEIEIPLHHFFDADSQVKDVLKAGLYRNRCVFGNHWKFATKTDSERWLCWSPTFAWAFNNPSRFGTITLLPRK